MALSGLRPSAPRVLSGTGWRLPDGFRAFGPGSYIVPLRWRGTAPTAPVYMPPAGGESRTAAKRHTKWRPQGAFLSPAQRCFITPESGALNPPVRRSRSQAEPLAPRAKGPAAPSTLTPVRACQPSGIQPRAAQVPVPPVPQPPPNAAKGRAPMSPAFSPLRKNMQGF